MGSLKSGFVASLVLLAIISVQEASCIQQDQYSKQSQLYECFNFLDSINRDIQDNFWKMTSLIEEAKHWAYLHEELSVNQFSGCVGVRTVSKTLEQAIEKVGGFAKRMYESSRQRQKMNSEAMNFNIVSVRDYLEGASQVEKLMELLKIEISQLPE